MTSKIDLDEIKSFLLSVQETATEDPAAFATTAITHFKRLLDTAVLLAAAVEHQTLAIRHVLEEDLATTSAQWVGPSAQSSFVPVPVYLDQYGRPFDQSRQGYPPQGGNYGPPQQPQWPPTSNPNQWPVNTVVPTQFTPQPSAPPTVGLEAIPDEGVYRPFDPQAPAPTLQVAPLAPNPLGAPIAPAGQGLWVRDGQTTGRSPNVRFDRV